MRNEWKSFDEVIAKMEAELRRSEEEYKRSELMLLDQLNDE